MNEWMAIRHVHLENIDTFEMANKAHSLTQYIMSDNLWSQPTKIIERKCVCGELSMNEAI